MESIVGADQVQARGERLSRSPSKSSLDHQDRGPHPGPTRVPWRTPPTFLAVTSNFLQTTSAQARRILAEKGECGWRAFTARLRKALFLGAFLISRDPRF